MGFRPRGTEPPSPPEVHPAEGLPDISVDVTPGQFSRNVFLAMAQERAGGAVYVPPDAVPTLHEVGDDMDLVHANMLLIRASRWLETLERQLVIAEVAHLLAKDAYERLNERAKFVYKSSTRFPAEVRDSLAAARDAAVELKAQLLVHKGTKASLQKVHTAASRTITRYKSLTNNT